MTTKKDNRQVRDESELWSASLEYTVGVPIDNSIDPTGQYPNFQYFFGSSINKSARGAEVKNLWSRGSYKDVDQNRPLQKPSVYPHNEVYETPFGHVISIDDTPGSERILIKHGSGSGVDMRSDGTVIISSKQNRVEVVGGKDTVMVEGSGHLIYKGNLNLYVDGDYSVNVKGDYNVNVDGQVNRKIKGSVENRIEGTLRETVLEDHWRKTMGNETLATMGKRTDVIKKDFTFINDENIDFRSSGNIIFSNEEDFRIASKNTSIISTGLALIGTEGTIGGENIEHYGKLFSGPSNGKGDQTTFYGTLIGLAHEATTSRYALYSTEAWRANNSRYAVTAEHLSNLDGDVGTGTEEMTEEPDYKMIFGFFQNNPEWRMPNKTMIDNILQSTEQGLIEVKVFDSDISDRITLDDDYEKYFNTEPTLNEIRQAMRYEQFRDGEAPFILVIKGLLSETYADGFPKSITNTADSKATARYGFHPLGNPIENTAKSVKGRSR